MPLALLISLPAIPKNQCRLRRAIVRQGMLAEREAAAAAEAT
jgi:hypothetical protein